MAEPFGIWLATAIISSHYLHRLYPTVTFEDEIDKREHRPINLNGAAIPSTLFIY